MTPHESEFRRRSFLKKTGAALGASLLSLGAGCTSTLPPLGSRVRYGRVDAPEPGNDLSYRKWLPAPSKMDYETSQKDKYMVMYIQPGELGEDVVGSDYNFAKILTKSRFDYLGIGFENYDKIVSIDGDTIIGEAEFNPSNVEETVTSSGYSPSGSYDEYSLFSRHDIERWVAVSDSNIVWSYKREVVKTVIDAYKGKVERYHEKDPVFDEITRNTGSNNMVWIFGENPFFLPSGSSMSAMSYTFNDQGVYFTVNQVYPSKGSVSKQKIKKHLVKKSRATNSKAVDIESNGRNVEIEMVMSHAKFNNLESDGRIPQVTWGVDYDKTNEEVTIKHQGGDSVDSSTLTIKYHDRENAEFRELEKQFSDKYEKVESGDSLTIDVSDKSSRTGIRLLSDLGDSWSVLFTYDLDDED